MAALLAMIFDGLITWFINGRFTLVDLGSTLAAGIGVAVGLWLYLRKTTPA